MSPARAVSAPCSLRYAVCVSRNLPSSGPTSSPITGTPSSTTTASSGEMPNNTTATAP